jgi:4-carboxymuconolactone decarboxylase
MPRIQPIAAKTDLPPEHQHVFDQVMGVFGRIRGPFSVLLHSPKLAERLLPMVPFAREGTIVDPKLRQIAVLAAVREREANYVWAAQVDASRRAGVREAVRRSCRRRNVTSWCIRGSSCGPIVSSRRCSTR